MVTLTENAAKQVRVLLSLAGVPEGGLRVSAKGGGCAGFTYSVELAKQPNANDRTFESGGISIFVDPKSYLFLVGIEIDYQESMMSCGFVFRNPNATKSCGCGKSFGV